MSDLEQFIPKIREAFKELANSAPAKRYYVVFPYNWFEIATPEVWVQLSQSENADIYFVKDAYTKRAKTYILNDKGKLELLWQAKKKKRLNHLLFT